MELKIFKVKNFRCIETAEFSMRDVVSLIGPNNAGKSSILRALQLFLDTTHPQPGDWPRGKKDGKIVFEAIFGGLTDEERKAPGIAGLVYDGNLHVRVTFVQEKGKAVPTYESYMTPEVIEGWSETWSECAGYVQELAKGLEINGLKFKSEANKELVREALRKKHPEKVAKGAPDWTGESMSIPQALQQALPRACFIPAVSDATEEASSKSGTAFEQLLSEAVLPAVQETPEFSSLVEAAKLLSTRLERGDPVQKIEDVKRDISTRLSDLIPAKVLVKLQTPDAKKYIGSNVRLGLDDGGTDDIGRQGHGLQRALIFSMLEHIAERTKASQGGRSSILLFEEPELYVHPHLLRRYRDVLRKIGARDGWQVVLTTHSPIMVDVGHDPQGLVIVRRKDGAPPKLHQPKVDPFGKDGEERERLRAVLDFHPTSAEAFFARNVVLVEGDSEVAVLAGGIDWPAKSEFGLAEAKDLTVVNCGGKWTIPALARVLAAFGVPFRIIHDADIKGRDAVAQEAASPIDPVRANAKIAAEVAKANEAGVNSGIHLVQDTLEDLLWPQRPEHEKDKPYKAWQRAKAIWVNPAEASPKLKEMLLFVFGPKPLPTQA